VCVSVFVWILPDPGYYSLDPFWIFIHKNITTYTQSQCLSIKTFCDFYFSFFLYAGRGLFICAWLVSPSIYADGSILIYKSRRIINRPRVRSMYKSVYGEKESISSSRRGCIYNRATDPSSSMSNDSVVFWMLSQRDNEPLFSWYAGPDAPLYIFLFQDFCFFYYSPDFVLIEFSAFIFSFCFKIIYLIPGTGRYN
jgi:hypothetical protein